MRIDFKMKKLLLITGLFTVSTFGFSQSEDPKKVVTYRDQEVMSGGLKVIMTDASSMLNYAKAKLSLTNGSNTIIMVKPKECYYTTANGKIFSTDKDFWISVGESKNKLMDVKTPYVRIEETGLHMDGIYVLGDQIIAATGDITMFAPSRVNIGNFVLELRKIVTEKKEMVINASVIYLGENIGVFNAPEVKLKSSSGKEYTNIKFVENQIIFNKNDAHNVYYQFECPTKNETFVLAVHDAFSEMTPIKSKAFVIPLQQ